MFVKFKLLEWKKGTSELVVTNCEYESRPIAKIVFDPCKCKFIPSQLRNEINNLFILKINDYSEEKIKIEEEDTLVIDSNDYSINLAKNNFLFFPREIDDSNSDLEIKCAEFKFNGDAIKTIYLTGILDDRDKETIELSKDENRFVFFKGVKNYLSADGALFASRKDIDEISQDVKLKLNLEIIVKKISEELESGTSNHCYLIHCKDQLSEVSKGLGNYEKIRVLSNEKIKENDLLLIKARMREVLRRNKENNILEISTHFNLIKDPNYINTFWNNKKARVNEKINELLEIYQDEYEDKVPIWRNNLLKNQSLFAKIYYQYKNSKNDRMGSYLLKQHFELKDTLDTFKNLRKLEQELLNLQIEVFVSNIDNINYQNQDNYNDFFQKLNKKEYEIKNFAKKLEKYCDSLEEYLSINWYIVLENDAKITKLLNNHSIDKKNFINNLEWNRNCYWLNHDGSINYEKFEEYLVQQKENERIPNDLGYTLQDSSEGKYRVWEDLKICKKEAKKALDLGYSPYQWIDPEYKKYILNNQDSIVADFIIRNLKRDWQYPLTGKEKKELQSSVNSTDLIRKIILIQEEKSLKLLKENSKKLVDQELKKFSTSAYESKLYINYSSLIDAQNSLLNLENCFQKIIEEILEIRVKRFSSVEEARQKSKDSIMAVLKRNNFEIRNFNLKYHDYQQQLDKKQDIKDILQFEQELTLLIELIQHYLQKTWFPLLKKWEELRIEKAKNQTSLRIETKKISLHKESLLFAYQVNQYVKRFQELQKEAFQDYDLQIKRLEKAQKLLSESWAGNSLNKEKDQVHQKVKSALSILNYLAKISKLQTEFNEFESKDRSNRKLALLREIQEQFKQLEKIKKLNFLEKKSKNIAIENIDLFRENEDTGMFTNINEKPLGIEIPLFNLQAQTKVNGEFRELSYIDNDFQAPTFHQQLAAVTFICLTIVTIRWWYKKKKEEDPFW